MLPCPYRGAVMTQVIVLNGGSSAGKSGVSRCLQEVLPDPWLAFGTDTLVEALPAAMRTSPAGIEFAPDGTVIVGPEFRTLEAAWIEGMSATPPLPIWSNMDANSRVLPVMSHWNLPSSAIERPFQAEVNRLNAQLRRARSQSTLAESNHQRGEHLVSQKLISQQDFDQLATTASTANEDIGAATAAILAPNALAVSNG